MSNLEIPLWHNEISQTGLLKKTGKGAEHSCCFSEETQQNGNHHNWVSACLQQAQYAACLLTTTEKEALILEASLIKKHRPRYNVILRNDKNYPLIKVTIKDDWPRLRGKMKAAPDN